MACGKNIQVAVIMGSDSDLPVVQKCADLLEAFGICYELKILSAHRSPSLLERYLNAATKSNVKIFIAAAGGAAHLAGVIASKTKLPVIGIPMYTQSLSGQDSLFSIVQMPAGIPVATMAIGEAGAKNAAIFAISILALSDKKISDKLSKYKKSLELGIVLKNKKLQDKSTCKK